MHILFLTDNFPPESNAPASRTYEHACEWVDAGHQVTVVTCAPNFPTGKVFDGYKNKLWQLEEMSGIKVIRVWSYMASNEGFARRIIDFTSYMVTGFVASLFVRRVDVVVGTSPQFFTAVAAWAAAVVKRRPFVFELRDIWPESIRAVSATDGGKLLDLMEKLELFLYRRAHLVVAVTHAFKLNLIARGIDEDKIEVITNGVDTRHFKPMPKDSVLLNQLDLNNTFVAGYIGTHGMAHALETLVEAARLLQDDATAKDIRIIMLGDGANRRMLMELAAGLDNILFIDPVPKDEVVRYWSILDVALIHLKKDDLFKTVIPSKMFECMGMGIPILHGVEGESADIIVDTGAGQLFEPQNPQDLVCRLKAMRANPLLRTQLAKQGHQRAAEFDRNRLANEMLLHLKIIAQQ
jgi:glycosyltransferase involved in cell wall biosynthesis